VAQATRSPILVAGGLSKAAAEETLGADPRDIEINLRALLANFAKLRVLKSDGCGIGYKMSDVHQLGTTRTLTGSAAFVEQALPAHEREQMFAHLAVWRGVPRGGCASLPSIDERQSVKPLAAARRPWWSGWNLALPAAAVLAGLSAFRPLYTQLRERAECFAAVSDRRRPRVCGPRCRGTAVL